MGSRFRGDSDEIIRIIHLERPQARRGSFAVNSRYVLRQRPVDYLAGDPGLFFSTPLSKNLEEKSSFF